MRARLAALGLLVCLVPSPLRAQDMETLPSAGELRELEEAETDALGVHTGGERCRLLEAAVLEAVLGARMPQTAAVRERGMSTVREARSEFRRVCVPSPGSPRRPRRDDAGSEGAFSVGSEVTSDLARDVETSARVTSLTPTELVIALDAAPAIVRFTFPSDTALVVGVGDALHVTRRTFHRGRDAWHALVVTDADGMLVLTTCERFDPTLLAGWDVRASDEAPGMRFAHTARYTVVSEGAWRRLETRDGVWQVHARASALTIVRTQ